MVPFNEIGSIGGRIRIEIGERSKEFILGYNDISGDIQYILCHVSRDFGCEVYSTWCFDSGSFGQRLDDLMETDYMKRMPKMNPKKEQPLRVWVERYQVKMLGRNKE